MLGIKFARRSRVQTEQISREQWNALLIAESHPGPPYVGRERRREDRKTYRAVARVVLGLSLFRRPKERFLIRTRDVSRHGVGFLHSRELKPGTRCELALLTADHGMVHRRGRVISCKPRGEEVFAVGIRLDKALKQWDFGPVESKRRAG